MDEDREDEPVEVIASRLVAFLLCPESLLPSLSPSLFLEMCNLDISEHSCQSKIFVTQYPRSSHLEDPRKQALPLIKV